MVDIGFEPVVEHNVLQALRTAAWRHAMRRTIFAISLLLAMLVAGCSTVVKSSKTVGDIGAAATSIDVVFVATPLASSTHTYSGNVTQKANVDQGDLGDSVLQHLPEIFSASGVQTRAVKVSVSAAPTKIADVQALFKGNTAPGFLLIRPISAVTTCVRGCFSYTVDARLLRADTGAVTWTATISIPPKASKFHDFGGVAVDFSKILLERLRKDGVVAVTNLAPGYR